LLGRIIVSSSGSEELCSPLMVLLLLEEEGLLLSESCELFEPCSLEMAESLEQLRWLENGYKIKVGISEIETIGIDTPEDLNKAEIFMKERGIL
jgi:hypothetical protein